MKQLANSSTAADANAAKSISLDHLGSIASRIYSLTKAEQPAEGEATTALKSLPQVWLSCSYDYISIDIAL
jgi:hypothetical protein